MDETEKMTALKKAYAEIILNTAKEAAARIIVSERRAQSFQRDLSSTKDEAFRILLRIKQMMDFKMNDADAKSMIQQKRIDELEAQLHEAEDIVSNLRAELYETQAELERLSRDQKSPLDDPVNPEETSHEEVAEQHESGLKNYETSVFIPPLQPEPQQVSLMEGNNSLSAKNGDANACYEECCYAGKTNATSILIRSTGPELYRNGCTHRIRACERNLLNGHLSLTERSDDLKCEKLVDDEKGGERISVAVPASGKETIHNEEKNPVHGKEIMNDSKAIIRLKRKRALRHKRNRAQKEAEPILIKKESATPDIFPSMACNVSNDNQELSLERRVSLTVPSESPEAATAEADNVSISVTDKDMELADALVLITQESESRTDIGFPVSEEEQDNPTSPLKKSNVQASDSGDAIPIQSAKDRIVKYTFQRKRKREPVSNDDVTGSPHDIAKQRTGKWQNDTLDSLTSESSRDSRRMAQVARQLVSLSEKKWW